MQYASVTWLLNAVVDDDIILEVPTSTLWASTDHRSFSTYWHRHLIHRRSIEHYCLLALARRGAAILEW